MTMNNTDFAALRRDLLANIDRRLVAAHDDQSRSPLPLHRPDELAALREYVRVSAVGNQVDDALLASCARALWRTDPERLARHGLEEK